MGLDSENLMTVEFNKKSYKYKLLHTLEFDSARKRMSVIIKNE